MTRRIVCAVVGFLAAICACVAVAAPARPAEDPFANIHTIGIVSALGDCFVMENVAGFTLDTQSRGANIHDWKLDEIVRRDIAAALPKRFEVRPVTYQLKQTRTCEMDFTGPSFHIDHPESVDALIIVRKWMETDIFTTNSGFIQLTALGLHRYKPPIGSPAINLHAFLKIAVVDTRTGKFLAQEDAVGPGKTWFGDPRPLATTLDSSFWLEADTFGPAEQERLRPQVVGLIRAMVVPSLIVLGLLPKDTPAPTIEELAAAPLE